MISVIIPFYNEEENIAILYEELHRELELLDRDYEIVLVNDGSSDNSESVAMNLAKKDKRVKTFSLRRRFGKGEALAKGIVESKGDILVFMDADLQDNPVDLPHFLKQIDDGYDLVNSVRGKRKHNPILKFYSALASFLLIKLTKSPFTDINAPFKAMKREIFDEIVLYGNNFRFFPLAAYFRGFKVTEIPVHHRERQHGKSKFGVSKVFIGLFDTVTAYFLYKFAEQPLHFFGIIGTIFFSAGFIIALELTIQRLFYHILLYRHPMLQFGLLLMTIGIQIVMTGIIGELIVYFNKRKK